MKQRSVTGNESDQRQIVEPRRKFDSSLGRLKDGKALRIVVSPTVNPVKDPNETDE